MKIDPRRRYTMPLMMGPYDHEYPFGGIVYRERQTLAFQFQTESEAISQLLPECFQPAGEPIVTVAFGYFDGIDFMAGGGYRIATVMVAVRFDGKQDHIEGNFPLVMFENDTLPIILGRERLGIHKIYADISPVKTLTNDHLRCEASLWGHLLFGIELAPSIKQDETACASAGRKLSDTPLLGYKFIQSAEGTPDIAYPICTPGEAKIDQMWLGESGNFFLGGPDEMDVSFISGVIDALKTLPVQKAIGTMRYFDSFVLRTDISRRLQ
jgi:acetoacetate decarboxylase